MCLLWSRWPGPIWRRTISPKQAPWRSGQLPLDPNDAEAHHLLGRIFLANGDLHTAAAELEKAKQLAPDNPLIRSHLAMVYSKLGRTQEAKAESGAFLALKNKEEVMESPQEKLGEFNRESAH